MDRRRGREDDRRRHLRSTGRILPTLFACLGCVGFTGCVDQEAGTSPPISSAPDASLDTSREPPRQRVPSPDESYQPSLDEDPSGWVDQFGSEWRDEVSGLAVAYDGVYAVGSLAQKIYEPDASDDEQRSASSFLRKYSRSGEVIWEETFESSTALVDVVHEDGAVFVIGTTIERLGDFAEGGSRDAFLRKYTGDGEVLWTRQFGTYRGTPGGEYHSANSDSAVALAVHDDQLFVAGTGRYTSANRTVWDPFVFSFRTDGQKLWGDGFDEYGVIHDIAADASGLYVAGDRPVQTSSVLSGWEANLSRYEHDGTADWRRIFDIENGPGPDTALSVVVDRGAVYVVADGEDYYWMERSRALMKFDAAGDVQWANFSKDHPVETLISGGTLYAAGSPHNDWYFDEEVDNPTVSIRRYNAEGRATRECRFDGPQDQEVSEFAVGEDSFFLAGYTSGALPGKQHAGHQDAFVARLTQSDAGLSPAGQCASLRPPSTAPNAPADAVELGSCESNPAVQARALGAGSPQFRSMVVPSVMDGAVYYPQTVDGQQELFMQRAGEARPTRVTKNEVDDRLVAASGGRVLTYVRTDAYGGDLRFQVRGPAGDVIREFDLSGGPSATNLIAGEANQNFDGERVLGWAEDDELRVFDTYGRPRGGVDFSGEHRLTTRAVLVGQGFAYTAAPEAGDDSYTTELGPAEVYLWRPDSGRTQLTFSDEDERFVFADGSRLFWVTEHGVYVRQEGRAPERIQRGFCGPPHAVDGKAAFACAESRKDVGAFGQPLATRLYVYDGERTRPISLDGDPALIHAVRVDERGVAWMEFDVASATCHGHTMGRVMYHGFDARAQVQVGSVLAPCWCCESNLPALELSLDDGVVAWNWSGDAPRGEHSTSSGYAFASVGEAADCP